MNLLFRYKNVIKSILMLILIMSIFTILHIVYIKLNKNSNDIDVDGSNYNVSYNNVKNINYEYIKKDLENLELKLENSENTVFDENVYKIDFYKNMSQIYENKLMEIKKIIETNLIDDKLKSEFLYNINKFLADLEVMEKQQRRYYESTIDSSLNIYKNRADTLKNKCYEIIEDFKTILENN